MCTNPIRIRNKKYSKDRSFESLEFNPINKDVDKEYLYVPCGECPECRQNAINQKAVRCYYEYLECKEHGGNTFFNTLTYNEVHVPRYCGVRCFSYRDYRLFVNRLRKLLMDKEYPVSAIREYRGKRYKVSNFKTFLACEYGEMYHRPHYHILFFCHFPIDHRTFCHYVNRCWQKGFTQFTNPFDKKYYLQTELSIVDSAKGAIQYVTKYCNKDQSFLNIVNSQPNHEFISHVVEKYKNKYKIECVDEFTGESKVIYPVIDESKIDSYKMLKNLDPMIDDLIPRSRYSDKLGIYALEKLSYEQLLKGEITMPNFKNKKTGLTIVQVPYYDRKLFYDMSADGKNAKLNAKGIEMRDLRTKHNIDYVENNIFETFYYFSSMPLDQQKKYLSAINKIHTSYNNKKEFDSFNSLISHYCLLDKSVTYTLAVYKTMYEGLNLPCVNFAKNYLAYQDTYSDIFTNLNTDQFFVNNYNLTCCQMLCDILHHLRCALGNIRFREYAKKLEQQRENKKIYDYYHNYDMYEQIHHLRQKYKEMKYEYTHF